jgi:Tfp pilus assembly protein PilX
VRVRAEESGFAVLVSIFVVGIMLSLGLAAFAYVGSQTSQSGQERVRESSFNLAEDALDSTVNFLSVKWPSASSPYPSSCTSTSSSSSCPSPAGVTAGFTGSGAPVDFSGTTWSWTTEVHDNNAPSTTYYDDSTSSTRGQPGYDANGDAAVWIRSQGIVRGRKRTIVSLVKIQQIKSVFPKNVITAGYFQTVSNGKRVYVNTAGNPPGTPGTLAVRCTVPANNNYPNSCLSYTPSKGQVFPDTKQPGYTGGNAMSSSDLDLMRQRAQASGSYYTTCPASLTGNIIFIEGPANCIYQSTATYNSASGTSPGPGFVIIANGTLTLSGTVTYYGLLYAANLQNSTGLVISVGGQAQVIGGIAVDGAGGVQVGGSGNNLIYDRNVFSNITANGLVGQVQNGFREIASP